MKTKKGVRWFTILDCLESICNRSLRFEIDIRYLANWIKLYPSCFPSFMLDSTSYEIKFDDVKLEYLILEK